MKVLRFVRLARVLKLVNVYEEMCEYVLTPQLVTIMNIAHLICALMLFIHYVACAWYAIGVASAGPEESWVSKWSEEDTSTMYLYFLSVHWSMAQFLPAPSTEHPVNFPERVFSVGVLFIGFLVFSSTVGKVTALITEARQRAYSQIRNNHILRRYFAENKVSHKLATIITHVLNRTDRQKGDLLPESQVPNLGRLPAPLHRELKFEVYINNLSTCPLFDMLDPCFVPALKEICDNATFEMCIAKGDVAFSHGAAATSMRFVRCGALDYCTSSMEASTHLVQGRGNTSGIEVGKDKYLSEVALWCAWKHCGMAFATMASQIVRLDVAQFCTVVQRHPRLLRLFREYVRLFCNRMEHYLQVEGPLDDNFCPFLSRDELGTELTSRAIMGFPSVSPHNDGQIVSSTSGRTTSTMLGR